MNPWSDRLGRLGSEHETDGLSRFPGSCYDKSAASSSVFIRRFADARSVLRTVSSYPRTSNAKYASRARPHKDWRFRVLSIWRVGT